MALSKTAKRRLWIYGTLVSLLGGFYWYQPIRVDLFPKPIPVPNPTIEPDPKALFKKGARVMIVTAHPDDSEFYLGPVLKKLQQAGATVDLVICTDGDKGFYPWVNAEKNKITRHAEQQAAAESWGVHNLIFLGFRDGRLQPTDEVIEVLHDQMVRLKPDWLMAFDGEYPPKASHGDHFHSGQAAIAASKDTGIKWRMLFSTHAPNYFVDVTDTEDSHRAMLALHKSQFSGLKLDKIVESREASDADDGDKIGVTFAIAFRVVAPLLQTQTAPKP